MSDAGLAMIGNVSSDGVGEMFSGVSIAAVAYNTALMTSAGTIFVWRPWMHEYSAIAAELAPMVVLALLLVQLVRAVLAAASSADKIEALQKLSSIGGEGKTARIAMLGGAVIIAVVSLFRLFRRPAPVEATPAPEIKPVAPKSAKPKAIPLPPPKPSAAPVGAWLSWFKLAQAEVGTIEGAGAANNPRVLAYYADAGFAGVKQDSVAWCAAFANAMLARAGYAGTASLAARSFLTWGKAVAKPYPGCIVIFARGDSAWQGHVAFYVSESATHIKVLGGNQSNKVCVQSYPKSKLLGYREPTTATNSRTIKLATAMTAVAAIPVGLISVDLVSTIFALGTKIEGLADTVPYAALIGGLVTIAGHILQIWIRMDDNTKKGGK